MSDSKLRPTSLDYSIAALAPVLIILMIGSLVAFLMTALYQGEFPARLMWILGLYTFASVLISRISIEQSRSQAFVYMALLGAATLFVAPRYFVIDGPLAFLSFPILVAFLILIAFLADRITYDCTSVDDAGDAHGEGLLQSLGLLKRSNGKSPIAKSKRKHNPGVWVLYFAILAVPVFGIGQLLIPTTAGRRLAFVCMWVYLTSALLLLVTISLLSVRSYARQRDVAMESGTTMRWLLAGGIAVLGLMLVMAILPLPSIDRSMWELPFRITSRDDLQSHRFGWGNEAPKPNPAKGQQPNQQQPNQPQPNQLQPNQPQPNQPQPNQPQPQPQPNAAPPANAPPPVNKVNAVNAVKNPPDPSGAGGNKPRPGEDPADAEKKTNQPQPAQPQPAQPPPSTPPMQIEWNIGASLRWLMLLALLGVAVFFGIRYRRELVAWFRETLAFWSQWFSHKDTASASEITNIGEGEPEPLVLFAQLEDPFARHANDPDRAIKALFDATLVWGREQRVVRRDDETPEEYVSRLGRKYSPIAESLAQLGMVYSRLAYAQKRVHPKDAMSLRDLWQWLASHPPRTPVERGTRPRDAVLE